MFTEARSTLAPCHGLFSRSAARSGPYSLDDYHQYNEIPQLAAGGFFPPDVEGKYSVLLEEPQTASPSIDPVGKYALSSSGRKRTEALNLLRLRSPLGHVPEGEELIIPYPHSQGMRNISLSDEDFNFSFPQRPDTRSISSEDDDFRFSVLPSKGMRRTSEDLPYFSASNGNFQRPHNDVESLMSSFSALCTIPRQHSRHEVLVYAPVKFCYADQDELRSDVPLAAPVYSCYNLRREHPRPSALNVHFQKHEDVSVPNCLPTNRVPFSSDFPATSSVSSDETEHPPVKTGLYKTELCRSWEETGFCRYSTKCQFAHGNEDLRPVPRHPKYKTEMCRSYTETGLCSYGKRCRFIHKSNATSSSALQALPIHPQKQGSRRLSIFQQLCLAGEQPPRQA